MINKSNIVSLNNNLFERHGFNLLCAFLFLVPLKLSLAYACFFPLILSGLTYITSTKKINEIFASFPKIGSYWLFFIISLIASAFFGLEPLKSVRKILELTFYSTSILVFYQLLKSGILRPVLFLVLGQAIAGAYSILEFANPVVFEQIFVGAVSESGQIAITIFLAFTASVFAIQGKFKKYQQVLVYFSLALIFMALILNMKRGPLLGVAFAGGLFCLAYRPKLLFAFIPMLVFPLAFIPAIRQRLLDSFDHFLISGGRYDIWEIGVELAGRYPLGIGYANSRHLQDFSNVIPENLKHFHNNYLNILVEGGMLSLLLYGVFFVSLLILGYKTWKKEKLPNDLLLLTSLIAILSWMVAGLVEYSFGDSEVMLIVYFLISYIFLRINNPRETYFFPFWKSKEKA